MTTIIPFLPSNIRTPTFITTLDGNDYEVRITWNISALRYYINIYDKISGAWIITVPLVSSPPARAVSSTRYDPFLGAVVVQMVDPNLWPVPATGSVTRPGIIVDYTLDNYQPDTYNGKFRCMHLNGLTFTFPMVTNPGEVIVLGRVNRLLNLVDTVFKTSTMIYRNGAFEINP